MLNQADVKIMVEFYNDYLFIEYVYPETMKKPLVEALTSLASTLSQKDHKYTEKEVENFYSLLNSINKNSAVKVVYSDSDARESAITAAKAKKAKLEAEAAKAAAEAQAAAAPAANIEADGLKNTDDDTNTSAKTAKEAAAEPYYPHPVLGGVAAVGLVGAMGVTALGIADLANYVGFVDFIMNMPVVSIIGVSVFAALVFAAGTGLMQHANTVRKDAEPAADGVDGTQAEAASTTAELAAAPDVVDAPTATSSLLRPSVTTSSDGFAESCKKHLQTFAQIFAL